MHLILSVEFFSWASKYRYEFSFNFPPFILHCTSALIPVNISGLASRCFLRKQLITVVSSNITSRTNLKWFNIMGERETHFKLKNLNKRLNFKNHG